MKIKLLSQGAKVPTKADSGAAGYDLYVPKDTIINPGRNIVPLDFAIAIKEGYEGHIRPRSGFSANGMEGTLMKDGQVLISFEKNRFDADVIQGTIDSSYRGSVGVIVKSHESNPFIIMKGTRIAQIVIEKCCMDDLTVVDDLDETERGDGGFGHTGTH